MPDFDITVCTHCQEVVLTTNIFKTSLEIYLAKIHKFYATVRKPGLQLQYTGMCVSKSEGHGSFFWPQASEMSEMVPLNTGEKLSQKLYLITCRNAISLFFFL